MFLANESKLYDILSVNFETAEVNFELRITCSRKVVYSYVFYSLPSVLIAVHDWFELHPFVSTDELSSYSLRIIPKPKSVG